MILIRSALESPDPGASNGGSNFIFGHFGADLVTFEVAGSPKLWISADRLRSEVSEILGDSGDFKSAQIGPRVSKNKV